MTNAGKGAYYKAKTRKWLAAQGYQVADMEIVRWIFTPKGRLATKRDQWGADLAGMNRDHIVLVQVKGGAQAVGGGTFPAARREFSRFDFPPGVQRWIVCWAPRSRAPRVIHCDTFTVTGGR